MFSLFKKKGIGLEPLKFTKRRNPITLGKSVVPKKKLNKRIVEFFVRYSHVFSVFSLIGFFICVLFYIVKTIINKRQNDEDKEDTKEVDKRDMRGIVSGLIISGILSIFFSIIYILERKHIIVIDIEQVENLDPPGKLIVGGIVFTILFIICIISLILAFGGAI